MDSTDGGILVINGVDSSLVSKVKEKQDQDPILLELKANVQIKEYWLLNKKEMVY